MSNSGKASTVNSTVVALGSGATFTGTGELNSLPNVGCMLKTDNTGTLYFDFSPDGTNWDSTYPVNGFTITSGVAEYHTAVKLGRWFRVRLVNDSGAQSYLRLATYFGTDFIPSSTPLLQTVSADQDTTLVRPVTAVELELAREHIGGQRSFFFFGHNEAVGTAHEDITPTGGDYPWPTAAAKVAISSSSAADTSAGLGVRSVEIHGLSATGADQSEIIATSGTTEVESTLDYVRVNKMHSETAGTYGGSHQGDITCRVTSAGAKTGDILSAMKGNEGSVDASVQYGSGEADNGYYTVPLGKTLYITRLEVIPNIGTNKSVDVVLYEREDILDSTAPVAPRREVWSALGFADPVRKDFPSHIKIKPLTDLWFRAKGSATSKIEVWLDFYLVDTNPGGT